MPPSREPAATRPIARVLPLLGLAHLDRPFDYLVSAQQDADAQPGVRVRVRFSGRLVDALLLERVSTSEHTASLRYLERVISAEVVCPPQLRELVDRLAVRYGGTRSDLYRAAIPPRHARAEESDTSTSWEELGAPSPPDLSAWSAYESGQSYVDAVLSGTRARGVWQVAPGEDWASGLAGLLVSVVQGGGGALAVLPDQRSVDRLEAALRQLVAARQVTVLGANLGPQARYRRYLSIIHGQARLVIGTRSAAFAPVQNLRLAVIGFDGDENLIEPRAPYPHAREVLTCRSAIEKCSLLLVGHTRTAEAQLLVESGWAHGITAPRSVVRARSPRIQASADSDAALARDPRARQARIPAVAFQALREALDRGQPVLVQTPRRGYVLTFACGSCRAPARCRNCNGPLEIPLGADAARGGVPTCRWCGRMETRFRCPECGSAKLRAVVLGNERTAEELGRAFPQVRVIASGGNHIVDEVPSAPALVVATPGAEPEVAGAGSYGALVLLDTWSLLGRQDLRATERALAAWVRAATKVAPARSGGRVVVVADSALAVVQAFIRWDVVGAAAAELQQRREVGLPPAVHMAAIDGAGESVAALVESLQLPAGAQVLGPVDLPVGVDLPGEYDDSRFGPAQRVLVRVPLGNPADLGRALKAGLVARVARRDTLPLRVMVDPVSVG
ncbi:primosome assembly protein PriA [Corynebacterium atypicum]|uniref:Probable replication restart protein PriA n=1 Tax=Corynebacterium atypicum TaxID=191610 RepID=A0ABN4DFE8_9CORY|nr:primosomal protein N' [Corynebacterium atypicum]AIG64079.1 primosome assembly protein PriA [Corynebacterium atypicum]